MIQKLSTESEKKSEEARLLTTEKQSLSEEKAMVWDDHRDITNKLDICESKVAQYTTENEELNKKLRAAGKMTECSRFARLSGHFQCS